jgi:hypothetical protein
MVVAALQWTRWQWQLVSEERWEQHTDNDEMVDQKFIAIE